MSRTRALWVSAILTIAIVLVAGTMLLRPTVSQPSSVLAQPEMIAAGDAGASQLAQPVNQIVSDHHDDHDQYEHHESHEEHEDGD